MATLAIAGMLLAGLTLDAPANAASPTSSAPQSSLSGPITYAPVEFSHQIDPGAATTPAPLVTPQPNYSAGSFFYVCVYTDGSTRTLTIGQKTTTCKSAAIQVWYESGQFVRTVQLTAGKVVPFKSSMMGCALGTASDVYAILAPGAGTVFWVAGLVLAGGLQTAACVSGT